MPELANTLPAVILDVTAKFTNVPIDVRLVAVTKLGWLLEFDVSVPVKLANPPPTAAKLFEKTFAGLISNTNV